MSPAKTASIESDEPVARLSKRIGRGSKLTGISLLATSGIFLVLSVQYPYIIFEMDSIVAFIAGLVLITKEQQRTVQAPVLNAILASCDRLVADLSRERSGSFFYYVPSGDGPSEVVILSRKGAPTYLEELLLLDGIAPQNSAVLTPPGRALAQLYQRELGLGNMSEEALLNSIPDSVKRRFALADKASVAMTKDSAEITLSHASLLDSCQTETESASFGRIGCTVASFFAVLFASATGRIVVLRSCEHDEAVSAWKIPMTLGPKCGGGP